MARLVLLGLLAACGSAGKAPPASAPEAQETQSAMSYPEAPRSDVVDTYHGVQVPDPYRWLEDPDSPETRAWITAQNELTQGWLGEVEARRAIASRLETLWNYERYGVPVRHAGAYWFEHNDGLQQQSVLMRAASLEAVPEPVLDPNTFSDDGTASLAAWSVTEDGRHLAYAVSESGSDWMTIRVRDLETGEDTADEVRWVKFSSPSWRHDGSGFFYSRFPEPADGEEALYHQQVWFHRLGTSQADDVLVHADPDHPDRGFYAWVTDDGRFLVLHVSRGTEEKSRIYYKELDGEGIPEQTVRLLDDFDADYRFVANDGRHFFFLTDLDAPRRRVIRIDLDQPGREHWTEVVPQGEDTLSEVSAVGGKLFLTYLHDAHTVVRVTDLEGAPLGEVELPGLGTAGGFGGQLDHDETFFYFTSYTTPTTIYHLQVDDLASRVFRAPEVAFDPGAFTTEQVFVTSPDGTRVPMFLSYKGELPRDGSTPTLLYGYGGFNISLTPGFDPSNIVWMEMGGVYAVANLRGGGEYGREWHEAGTLQRKQNVFDDFIASAEWLIEHDVTRREKLGTYGRSNGGLLIGATVVQRPDLFGAAIPAVGVLDMLRYHEWTIGWAWASDYGTSDDADMFQHLLAYSPVHNAEPAAYPPVMVATADHDDRVVPAHSFKFAAALQHAQEGAEPVLIRIETRAGHGAGKSTSMRIEEKADMWTFLVRALDMRPELPDDAGG